ncbi:MAG TPA: hypothetical protein VEV87_02915 [Chitinophagaceae bacterium]|nr:hypothetical protein [Chitinophagaceae bacterium]
MKINCKNFFFLAFAIFWCQSLSAQKNKAKPIDSTLEANSEKWKVKLHKGLGKAKPEFGPYNTIEIKKIDSPVLRKRTKEGSYSGATITSESWDWDFSKYKMTEKRKAYRMLITKGADTSEMLFSFYTVSHDKQLSFFGELMSKDDEGKNLTLAYKKNISGIIGSGIDSIPCRFFVEDSFSRNSEETSYALHSTTMTRFYIVTGNDSIYTEPIMQQIGKPGDKYAWAWQTGIFVRNSQGNRIAALKFGAAGDLSNPFYVWIRKDVDPASENAIASLFALLMFMKTS